MAILLVSIHAPTRGATEPQRYQVVCFRFQSTLPRGERHGQGEVVAKREVVSIHAPTRGATAANEHEAGALLSFNPRSHEGSDWLIGGQCLVVGCFNPRSHEGSDQSDLTLLRDWRSFNPRSHEGSDSFF